MNNLIAVVATAMIVNGERTVIQPGQPLPELNEHDAEALKRSGAALDPDLSAEAHKVVEAAALAAAASFQAERQRVQAETASSESPGSPEELEEPGAPAGKTGKKR